MEILATNTHVDLIAQDIDVALRAGRITDPNLIARTLARSDWVAVASAAYLRAGSAVRLGAQSERAFPHAAPGRGVRRRWRRGALGEGASALNRGGAATRHPHRAHGRALARHPGLRR
ncbi:MAG: hypothetical protein GWP91_24005 [Rhodobacterales bacterium]|nr:hypothetical protein [Rhodobacterales bacterium]